jgi:heat shock protein HslJ
MQRPAEVPLRLPRLLLRAAALFALATIAQVASAGAAEASLLGTHWRLVSVDGTAADLSGGEPGLELASDGTLAGNTGCNTFGGGYTLDGASLSFSQLFSTRMYCDALNDQEQALLDAFGRVDRWKVEGGRLELQDRSGITLAVFEAGAAAN